eukprot:GFYU01001717.1.p1 GENE.GFYU01001717.1~~GFYU01001717.1.p1  ORF type:complete len:281 (+),score=49.10 GFYU01001717.1:38-880(+)
MSTPTVPPSLKKIAPYFQRAAELQKGGVDPVVPYYCQLHAMNVALTIRATLSGNDKKDCDAFLGSIMGQLEKTKKALGPALENGPDTMEFFALDLFQKADDEDRRGAANKTTVMRFKVASDLISVCSQFPTYSDDLKQKQKYAAWKATDIMKALRAGVKPTPGPPGGSGTTEEQELENEFASLQSSMGGGGAPSNITSQPQPPTSHYTSAAAQPPPPAVSTQSVPTPQATAPSSASKVSAADVNAAKKQCKIAMSALDFEDVPTAVANLKKALSLLGESV